MLELTKQAREEFIQDLIGTQQEVLWESYKQDHLEGWTVNYVKVKKKGNTEELNKIEKVKITEKTYIN